MKVLVAVADYPNLKGLISMYYVHIRNLYYKRNNYDVDVLNFSCNEPYMIDGVSVFDKRTALDKMANEKYDVLICHAPNIRNHYLFLNKYQSKFENIILFFHGHEVLKISKVYSEPYRYMKQKKSLKFQDIYDTLKLFLWGKYIPRIIEKTNLVFVSNWMLEEFLKWTRIPIDLIEGKYSITYNSVGQIFEREQYDFAGYKKYDFVTIRNNLDGSKYAIDVVCQIANHFSDYSFCIVGCGQYFDYYEKPKNVEVISKLLSHEEIIGFLNLSKCALLPTRTDAQGVMACEMATFGIPLITSDISVCKEVFVGFDNVKYINNDKINFDNFIKDFNSLLAELPFKKVERYFEKSTCDKEMKLIDSLKSK